MTRGRKKDQTLPPTRALTHQREYRSRRAQYVADLEKRCHAAEEESRQLKLELDQLRAARPSSLPVYSPEAAQALSTLLQHLSGASSALEQFQHLATSSEQHRGQSPGIPPCDATMHPFPEISLHPLDNHRPSERSKSSSESAAQESSVTYTSPMSPSIGSDQCCGGWVDCRDLVEEGPNSLQEGRPGHNATPMVSDIRSTCDKV